MCSWLVTCGPKTATNQDFKTFALRHAALRGRGGILAYMSVLSEAQRLRFESPDCSSERSKAGRFSSDVDSLVFLK